jgi:hypothetical protein
VIAIDWNATTIAGGFVVGVIAGGFAVIRVTRYVLEYLRNERRESDD